MCWSYACFSYAGGGVLTACDPHNEEQDGTHTHEWSEEYSYDDDTHYKTCTVEGCDQHTGTEAHEFTDDQDAKCDVCGYERHVHETVWKWDSENHWKEYICEHHADEQLNKDRHVWGDDGKCTECQADKSTFHTHDYEWKYDDKQHWQLATCEEHPGQEINGSRGAHDFKAGVCDCGLKENYVKSYKLYCDNQTYKGEDAKSFGDWDKDVQAKGFVSVSLNSAGDAVLNFNLNDTQSTETYYAPRTYTVKAVDGTTGIENVYFSVKVYVDGKAQELNGKTALVVGETSESGTVKLTFTPIWGYTSTKVIYNVNIAAQGEMDAPYALPGNYLYEEERNRELVVDANKASDNMTEQTFSLTKCLGVGDRFMLENVPIENLGYQEGKYNVVAYTAKLSKNRTEGWYKLDYETTTKGNIPTTFGITIGSNSSKTSPTAIVKEGSGETGGGLAYFLFYLTDDITEIGICNGTAYEHVANITLTKLSGGALDVGKPSSVMATPTGNAHKLAYSIKSGSIAAGKYKVMFFSPVKEKVTAQLKFDDGESIQIEDNPVIELKGDEKTFTLEASKAKIIQDFYLLPVTPFPEENSAQMQFDADHAKFIYSWTPAKTATYRFVLSSTSEFSGVTLKVGDTTIIRSSAASIASDGSYLLVGYFEASEVKEYQISVDHEASYLALTLAIENEANREVEAGKEFDVTFDSAHSTKNLAGQLEPGLYAVTVHASEDISAFTFKYKEGAQTSTTTPITITSTQKVRYSSALLYLTDKNAENGKVSMQFTAQYSNASKLATDATFTVMLKLTKIETINAVTFGTQFEFGFTTSNIYAIDFTPDQSFVYNLHLTSDSDIAKISMPYCTITSSGTASANKLQGPVSTGEAKERDCNSGMTTIGTRYIIAFIYEDTTYSVSNVKATLNKTFASPSLAEYTNTSSSTSSSNGPSTGVGFNKVTNATKYELYEAVTDSATAPAVGDEAFKLVKTYSSEDVTSGKYKVTSKAKDVSYVNNTVTENKYFYYYLVVSGADDYVPYTTTVVMAGTTYNSNKTRTKYTVNLTVPTDFVGKDFLITFTTKDGMQIDRTTAFEFVTPEQETTSVTILCSEAKNYEIAPIGWSNSSYNFPSGTVSTTINATVTAYPTVTVTVNFPDNFITKNSGGIKLELFMGSNNVPSATYTIPTGVNKALDKQYTHKFTITNSAYFPNERNKDNFKVKITAGNGVLSDGYVLPADVPITIDEGYLTGSAEVTFDDRCEVTATLKLPDNFIAGYVTIAAYEQKEDGSLETKATTTTASQKINQDSKEATVPVYVPLGHTYTLKLTLENNYTAEDVKNVSSATTTAKAEFTVTDHIDVTVTVTAPAGLIPSADSLTINLYEAEGGQPKGTKEVSKTTVKFGDGETSKEVHLYAPFGTKELIVGGASDYHNKVTEKPYCWPNYATVSIQENKGTATFAFEGSYAINLSVPDLYTNSKSEYIYIYKDGVSLYGGSKTFNQSTRSFTLYMPTNLYEANAKFVAFGVTSLSGWSCPETEIKFNTDTKSVDVQLGYVQHAKLKVTLNVPEGFAKGTGNYTLTAYKKGSTNNFNTWTISSNDINLNGNKATFELEYCAWLTSAEYVISGSSIDTPSSHLSPTGNQNLKDFYSEKGIATYDASSGEYLLTIDVKATTKIKITVTAPDDYKKAGYTTTKYVYLYDKDNKQIFQFNLGYGVNDTGNKTFELNCNLADPAVIDHGAMTADSKYDFVVTITKEDGSFSINIVITDKPQ